MSEQPRGSRRQAHGLLILVVILLIAVHQPAMGALHHGMAHAAPALRSSAVTTGIDGSMAAMDAPACRTTYVGPALLCMNACPLGAGVTQTPFRAAAAGSDARGLLPFWYAVRPMLRDQNAGFAGARTFQDSANSGSPQEYRAFLHAYLV